MKEKKTALDVTTSAKQERFGAWTMGFGQLLLAALVVLCIVDVSGMTARGSLLVPLSGYLACIFIGVAMQFAGSAIPHMKFAKSEAA